LTHLSQPADGAVSHKKNSAICRQKALLQSHASKLLPTLIIEKN